MPPFRKILLAIAALLGAVIAVRYFTGPVSLAGLPITTPANPEGFFGLALTLLFVTAPKRERTPQSASLTRHWTAPLTASLAALGALASVWRLGFLSDDFILVKMSNAWTSANFAPTFTTPGGDGFFRPIGYLSLAATARFAAFDPAWWHIPAILLHALNSALVSLLARRLGAAPLGALLAGALFAVHGTHLEAALWIAGRFDVLATALALGCLLLYGRSLAASLACCLLAILTKESAYVLPALLVCIAIYEKRPWRSTLPHWILCSAAFLYRWILFGGIGGYTVGSQSQFFSLGFNAAAKALFDRLWTSLYFPVNWSADPGIPLAILAAACIAALLYLGWRATPSRVVWLAGAALLISMLPPLHLFNGAPDLAGGRLLYFPSIWFCILLAACVEATGQRAALIALLVFGFHTAALWHNLQFWSSAARQVDLICTAAAEGVVPADKPTYLDGVPALANGFPECVEFASTRSTRRVQ